MSDKRRAARLARVEGEVAYIPLGVKAKHGFAIVDADMAYLAEKYKWTLSSNRRYVVTGTYELDGQRLNLAYLHRVVMGFPDCMVDHISRDRLDNRRCNLRIADSRLNQINTSPRGGTSAYRGVFWHESSKKWHAQIKNYGKKTFLGSFIEEKQAALAYNHAAKKLFGADAQLNEIN